MQSKISFSNSSFNNLNKYIKPDNQGNSGASSISKNNAPEVINFESKTENLNTTLQSTSNPNAPSIIYKETKSAYSITSHSDKDNVNINQIRCIIRDFKNDLKKLQKEDCIEYNRLYLKNTLGFSDEDAEKYSKEIYQIMLDYYGVDNINDSFKRDDFKNEVTFSTLMVRLSKAGEEQKLKDITDAVGTTNFINMMNNYQNNTVDYLQFFNDYLVGKSFEDAMSFSNYSKYLRDNILKNADDNVYATYQYVGLHKYFRNNLNFDDYDLSDEMKKSVVKEIVDEDGYDAMVLHLVNGNYAIVNSCTNESESEDMGAIVGNIASLACDDDFSKDLFNLYSRMLLGTTGNTTNDEYSDAQVTACEKLIKKYIDNGKNMELYGYSLGGGIMEAAYSRIKEEGETKYTDKIKSVCVYNPFTLIAELDEKANIKNLVGDKKFLRYCAESDVVSTFNNYVEQLDGNTLYLNAADINSRDWFEQRGKACSPLELFTKGNHSFSAVNGYKHSSFDTYGNVTKGHEGSFASISNVINALEKDYHVTGHTASEFVKGQNYNGYKEELNSMSLDECMKNSFKDYVNLIIKDTGFESKLGDFGDLKDELLDYMGENFGEIKYKHSKGTPLYVELGEDTLGDIIGEYMSEFIWNIVKDTEVEKGPFTFDAATFVDQDDLEDAVWYAFANDTDNIYKIIEAKYSKNNEAACDYVDDFIDNLMDDYENDIHWNEIFDKIGKKDLKKKLKSQFKDKLKINGSDAEESFTVNNNASLEYQHLMETIENGTYDGGGLINPDYTSTTTTTTTTVAK